MARGKKTFFGLLSSEKAKVEAEKAKAEVERVRDEAEQHGYDVSVVETEKALRVEVSAVCRAYCT